jgi:hypothetical protein
VRGELDAGQLKQLPLRAGAERFADLYLIFADSDYAGPATRELAALIRERVAARGADRISRGRPLPADRRVPP